MPLRALILLLALVLGLHWLALGQLPLGASARVPPPEQLAFDTRLLPPPAPEPPAPEPPAPRAPARAAPPPAPPPAPPAAQVRRKPPPARPPAPRPPAPLADEPPPAETAAPDRPGPPQAAEPAEAPPGPGEDNMPEPLPDPGREDGAADFGPPPEPAADAQQDTPAEAPAPAVAELAPAPAGPGAAGHPPAPAAPAGVEILLPGGAAAFPDQEPPPVRLPPSTHLAFAVRGQAKGLQYHASATLDWRQDGDRYEAHQQVRAFLIGARSQSSRGRLGARGLQPERFGDKTRSERAAHFDYERREIVFSANVPPAPLVEGAQDRLSIFIQLGSLLAAAPQRYPAGTRIALPTVGVGGADRWAFTVEGPEMLELPAGPTPALKMQRLPPPDRPYDQKAELWLGTALGGLPVRIRITQASGDWVDLVLEDHGPL